MKIIQFSHLNNWMELQLRDMMDELNEGETDFNEFDDRHYFIETMQSINENIQIFHKRWRKLQFHNFFISYRHNFDLGYTMRPLKMIKLINPFVYFVSFKICLPL